MSTATGAGTAVEEARRAASLRAAGDAAGAERLARDVLSRAPACAEAAVVLGLALFDQGRTAAAREALEAAASRALPAEPASAGAPQEVTDTELDQAFADAEPDADEVIDADRVAREAIDQADRELVSEVVGSPDSSFATQTMAELLELQGEAAGASRIRASLESPPPEQMLPPAVSHGDRVLRTLEQWLANLERPR